MTVFKRAPRPETQQGEVSPELFNQGITTLLKTIENDPSVNHHANPYIFRSLYKEQGIDLDSWYANRAVTKKQETIKDNFLHNKKHGFAAELAETLPLLANAQGRLGPYIKVKVTKTAKPDDQGNSFIDLILEVENTWLATEAPLSLQNTPSKMTFLIDVTTAVDSEALEKKIHALRDIFLLYGEKANVKCYQDGRGNLGIERPKIIVAKQSEYIEKVGATLGNYVTQLHSNTFAITKPEKFNELYQSYFLDLITSVGQNAQDNAEYIKGLEPGHTKRTLLLHEYEKINAFVEAYKKTPTARK